VKSRSTHYQPPYTYDVGSKDPATIQILFLSRTDPVCRRAISIALSLGSWPSPASTIYALLTIMKSSCMTLSILIHAPGGLSCQSGSFPVSTRALHGGPNLHDARVWDGRCELIAAELANSVELSRPLVIFKRKSGGLDAPFADRFALRPLQNHLRCGFPTTVGSRDAIFEIRVKRNCAMLTRSAARRDFLVPHEPCGSTCSLTTRP